MLGVAGGENKVLLGNKQPVQRTPNLHVLSALKHDMRSAKMPSSQQFLPKPHHPAPDPQPILQQVHCNCQTSCESCGQMNWVPGPGSLCWGGGSGGRWAPCLPGNPTPTIVCRVLLWKGREIRAIFGVLFYCFLLQVTTVLRFTCRSWILIDPGRTSVLLAECAETQGLHTAKMWLVLRNIFQADLCSQVNKSNSRYWKRVRANLAALQEDTCAN